ncbi:hypothetical protein [Paenibacillus dendritiformis]|uniref:hypothetical protein n=1 Tax=Paenibacillus dendritiformis TaxID=130049 RepID=UPI001BCCB56D|nr:hypothetical protein [Paenibacillus dendritiformis]
MIILSALDELNAKSVADGFFIYSTKAAVSPATLVICSTNAAKMQEFLLTRGCENKIAAKIQQFPYGKAYIAFKMAK